MQTVRNKFYVQSRPWVLIYIYMSDDLNSLYDPWSREFGAYVIVFQGCDFYVCYRFLVNSLSFSKARLYQNPTATTLYFPEF